MFDHSRLIDVLKKYKEVFVSERWNEEKYKWEAVKWFQNNWDVNVQNFPEMLNRSLDKTMNLLASANNFPRGMIVNFAKSFPEEVRSMFIALYDESRDVFERMDDFKTQSASLLKKYGGSATQHFQNENAITTYLWLRFPDKYYIYKYGEVKAVAAELKSDYSFKKGAYVDNINNFLSFYGEISEALKDDNELIEQLRTQLTDTCYPDPELKTLTIDVGFYISRVYSKIADNVIPKKTIQDDIVYWPSQEDYPVNISKEEWKKYIEEIEHPNHKGCMGMFKALMELGGEASCKKLSVVYGGNPSRYVGSAVNTGKRAQKYFGIPSYKDGKIESNIPIPFLGRIVIEDGKEYYSYKIREELLQALNEIDLSDIDPYVQEIEDNSGGYWWLNANPKIWSFSNIETGSEQAYTLYNENGNKRRVFQNFLDAKTGDMVIGYESTPVKQIVALAKISKEQDGKEVCFQKIEGLAVPIDYQTIKECPELKGMEYFAQPQGSLFRLTKDEYDFIMDIIRESNPVSLGKETLKKYSKVDFLNEVFMEESSYDALVSLLKNKKNLILQGAPGVGKTFAAKRLAYSIMGEIDESRIEFVQFHQNYSYEDFMMGYKPVSAGFELQHGIFYRFCQMAANRPEKDFFFIIDEINRGNLSKIFGELLMLIEKDYRGTKTTLAYNGMPFSVPKNLYIIGMMNTADRSLAMIDYALRRRFSFYTMEPGFSSEGFKKYKAELKNPRFDKLVSEVVSLNSVISNDKSLGQGFCIGHSYFCGHKAGEDDRWISEIVEYDIIPMLNEYWFDDSDKVKEWSGILKGI